MYMLSIVNVRQHLIEECLVCYTLLTISFERENIFIVNQTNHKEKALHQIRSNCSYEIHLNLISFLQHLTVFQHTVYAFNYFIRCLCFIMITIIQAYIYTSTRFNLLLLHA